MFSWQLVDSLSIDRLVQVELPKPDPGPGELLVKVEVAALNYSDLLMIAGTYQIKPPKPFTPGQEVAGTVVAAGEGTSYCVGHRIASKVPWGGFAEYAIVRADMAISVPDTVPLSSAVALPIVYTTSMIALQQSTQVQAGDSVLIHAAAGGVGLAAVQIARYLGATVFATAGSDEKCRVAKEHGAVMALNYRNQDWRSEIMNATEGKGMNIIFDSVGGDVTLASLKCLAWQGRLLIVGFSSGDLPSIPAQRLLLKRASAIGVYWTHDYDREILGTIGQQLVKLCESGVIRPVIRDCYGFLDLPQALRDLRDRNSVGKLVVKIG